MSKLLIDEKPIMILPELAQKIGLHEAVLLQQIHYWLESSEHKREGKKWIYNTYPEWQKQLPFWSESTIKRAILSLEKQGLILTGNFNRKKMDKTKWYTVDYKVLEGLGTDEQTLLTSSTDQHDMNSGSDWPMEEVIVTQAIPESTTESTTENIYKIPFSEIVTYLNDKTNSSYSPGTSKTKKLIKARWNEGYQLEDFKKVIDLKTEEWLNNPTWNKYLRPETLFGSKFESYRNQKTGRKNYCEGDFNLDDEA